MHFETGHVYHVYNRGNNRVKIFLKPDNYHFLLRKVQNEWRPYCDILCYCLMPNHFHFMLHPNSSACNTIFLKDQESHLQILSKAIGKTLSSYTQAINIQNNTTGNLFQKKTRAKCLTESSLSLSSFTHQDYLLNCFHYIHNNPLAANIVKTLEDWPYSSWPDYYGLDNKGICNKDFTMKILGLLPTDFTRNTEVQINKKIIEHIW